MSLVCGRKAVSCIKVKTKAEYLFVANTCLHDTSTTPNMMLFNEKVEC